MVYKIGDPSTNIPCFLVKEGIRWQDIGLKYLLELDEEGKIILEP